MTDPMKPAPLASAAPPVRVSMNDSLPTSSHSPKSTLIGLACIVGAIVLIVLYAKIIGF